MHMQKPSWAEEGTDALPRPADRQGRHDRLLDRLPPALRALVRPGLVRGRLAVRPAAPSSRPGTPTPEPPERGPAPTVARHGRRPGRGRASRRGPSRRLRPRDARRLRLLDRDGPLPGRRRLRADRPLPPRVPGDAARRARVLRRAGRACSRRCSTPSATSARRSSPGRAAGPSGYRLAATQPERVSRLVAFAAVSGNYKSPERGHRGPADHGDEAGQLAAARARGSRPEDDRSARPSAPRAT